MSGTAPPGLDALGPGGRERVRHYLERAADPEAVLAGLRRILDAGADPVPHLDGWLRLIDASPMAVETIVRRPGLAADLPARGGTRDRSTLTRELDDALRALPTLAARLDHLRAVRVEETLRIAWQDVVGGADLAVVTHRISELAETLIQALLELLDAQLARAYGRPWAGAEPVGLSVIAMGKLGGAELNYSSDIDLIFLYGKDGRTDGGPAGRSISNREYFHRLGERLNREANAVTAHGRLYRVDLRLRPEGATGSLARSLASSVAYYLRTGETWERQALLKARVIAGDRRVGGEFVASVRDWAYGRGLSFAEIGALKRIKERMETITRKRGDERSEVKLGYGGIRDVEYVIQFLQLLHGERHPEVRHHNSLAALRLLERAGAILAEERDVLDDAYRFLRLIEHRLQLVHGAQLHRIPSEPRERTALARRCGYRCAEELDAAYRRRAEAVRVIFDRLFFKLFTERGEEAVRETDLVLQMERTPDRLERSLAEHGVSDTGRGVRLVAELCRESSPLLAGSPRPRKFFAHLFPRLLDALARTPDPDAALRRLERISARVGARATLYEAMAGDDRLLSLLVDLAGHSAFLSRILERAPGTLDQLVDALATEPARGLASFEDIPTATVPSAPDPARILSDYKNLETLRIGLRDVRGEQGVEETGQDLTRLAEIVLRLAYERARREARAAGADLVVLALGRLGSGELLYGSDLDVVYFTRDGASLDAATGVARRLSALLATPTVHGRLYEVDHRLRPGGAGGPLVTTPSGFADYFERGLGHAWERMAYTRARAIAGPPTLCEEIDGLVAETIFRPGFGAADARAMAEIRERVAEAGGPASLKRARAGGMVDVEFTAQMIALRRGRDDPRFREGNVARLLGVLPRLDAREAQRAADLQAAYGFLVSLESRLRIVADLPEDELPADDAGLRGLARRLGYVASGGMSAVDALREEADYHREVAARAFRRTVAELSRE